MKNILATGAILLVAAVAIAQVPPEGDPAAARTYAAPDVAIPNAHQPLSKLSAGLATRLQQQITALGISGAYAAYDLRGGRFGTLAPAKPLLPGAGVGNSLTWAALGAVAPTSDAAYKQAAWNAFKAWLDAGRPILGIDSRELGSPVVSSYEDRRLVHISANRTVNGVPVFRTFVQAAVNSGNLVLYGAYNWGPIDVATTPTISAEQAKSAVAAHLSGFSIAWDRTATLVLLPLASGAASEANEGRGYRYRLAWEVHPRVAGSLGGWEGLVDAHSGQLLAFHDRNHYLDQKKIVGGIFPVSNDGQSPGGVPDGVEHDGYPMSHAYVFDAQGNRLQTNSEGLVSVDGAYSTELAGPFLKIADSCGAIDETSICPLLDLASGAGTDCAVPPGHSAGDTHSARTGFYEVNRVIDQAKSWLGPEANANTPVGWLNRQLPANMNLNNTCNAFFSPLDTSNGPNGSINFYRSGLHPACNVPEPPPGCPTICRNTGEIAAIFDHEWGHGLDSFDNAAGVSLPGEAYADMTAIHRLNQSCIARGFYSTNSLGGVCGGNGDPCTECSGVREADWKKRQSGKPHDLAWVLGQNPTIPGSCPISPVATSPISPTPFNSGPCFRNTHCEGSIITEAVWDLLKRDLPCHTRRWEVFPGGAVYGGRCTNDQAATIDENSALVLGTRLFYLASNGISMGYQCGGAAPGGGAGDPSIGGCTAGSWYLNYLAADDDDGSLANGTPHMVAINDAFVRHGIACPPQAPPAGILNFGCTATPPPTVKSAVTATAGLRSATVTWTPVPGAGKYWVLRSDGVHGCNFGKTRVAEIPATAPLTLTQTDLLDGLTYYYSVVGVAGAAGIGIDSCAGAMSDCAAVTPSGPDSAIPAGLLVEQTGAPVIETGDGDAFVDNCEEARLSFDVINIGTPLTGVKVTAIAPSNSQTQVLTPLPISLPDLPYGCGSRAAATPVTFRFRTGGAAPQSSMTFSVTATANELAGPVTGTLTIDDLETDLGNGSVTFDFESGTQGWEVVSGAFTRTDLPPPAAAGSSFYMKSSSAVDRACDRVRSPKVRLTATSTLSLYNQFATEAETPATPFYDRANVGIIDTAGARTIVNPDGGRPYNALNEYTGCNNGPGWATDIPDAPDNRFAQSSWSSGALNAAGYVGQEVQIEVTNGTDGSAALDGFQFDQVVLTDVLVKVPDAQSNVCASTCSPDVDDSAPAVEYTGGWHLREDSRASNGGYHRRMGSGNGNGPARVARIVFSGDSITYHYVKSDNGGTADVIIDGTKRETLSYGPNGTGKENPTFGHSRTYSGLGAGQHELRIEHKTGAAYVDGFTIPCDSGGADASAARSHSETSVSSGSASEGALIERTVTVGDRDVEVSVVVEGSLVPLSVRLLDPLGNLVASGQALISGLSTSGLDAAVTKTGVYKLQVVNAPGAFQTIQISVARTVRN